MAYEIERKFLTSSDTWRDQIQQSVSIKQAYFCNTSKASLRVRVADQSAFLSSKSMTKDIRRHEFEYEIPKHDAEFMLIHMCQGHPLSKTRHYVKVDQHTWEVDEFHGANDGLIVAEIELQHETEPFSKPEWVGEEVSNDARYFNMALVSHPYQNWTT